MSALQYVIWQGKVFPDENLVKMFIMTTKSQHLEIVILKIIITTPVACDSDQDAMAGLGSLALCCVVHCDHIAHFPLFYDK